MWPGRFERQRGVGGARPSRLPFPCSLVTSRDAQGRFMRGRGPERREAKPGDINTTLNGEILTVVVRARCQRLAQFA